MGKEITADDITQYLDNRDDFDLELFALRELKSKGWNAHHGGTYTDPITAKPRQYDIKAWFPFSNRCELLLTVECKSLSTEFPLLVSRVPRDAADSHHSVVRRTLDRSSGYTATSVYRPEPRHPKLYAAGQMVGKSTTQLKWNDKKWVSSDSETYDKWAQALASGAEFLSTSTSKQPPDATPVFTCFLPVLVVSDQTLWTVDYADDGTRAAPLLAEEATLFVDRVIQGRGPLIDYAYHITHLHIFTRTGFTAFLQNLAAPSSTLLDRIFGSALRATYGER